MNTGNKDQSCPSMDGERLQQLKMSFGNYQYQHRFYNPPSTKRYQAQSVPYYPPLQQPVPSPYSAPKYQVYEPLTNDLNLRVRGGPLRKNEPGWDGYRMKSYVTDKYSMDYRHNADMLQRFRREAQQLRRRKRFIPQNQQDSRFVHLPEVRRVITEPQQIYQQPPSPIAHYESEQHNPQAVKQYDVGIMARMDQLRQEREIVKSRLESMRDKGIIDQMKVQQYKRKYSKLKRKLKEEIMEKKLQGLVQQKRNLEDYNERKHIDALEQLMTDISTKLNRNSQLLNQSLKIKEEIHNKSTAHSRITADERPRVEQSSIHYSTLAAEEPISPSTPTIVYKEKDLKSQYLQLQRLNRQVKAIAKLNK